MCASYNGKGDSRFSDVLQDVIQRSSLAHASNWLPFQCSLALTAAFQAILVDYHHHHHHHQIRQGQILVGSGDFCVGEENNHNSILF